MLPKMQTQNVSRPREKELYSDVKFEYVAYVINLLSVLEKNL